MERPPEIIYIAKLEDFDSIEELECFNGVVVFPEEEGEQAPQISNQQNSPKETN